jgi:hypothetical protein
MGMDYQILDIIGFIVALQRPGLGQQRQAQPQAGPENAGKPGGGQQGGPGKQPVPASASKNANNDEEWWTE